MVVLSSFPKLTEILLSDGLIKKETKVTPKIFIFDLSIKVYFYLYTGKYIYIIYQYNQLNVILVSSVLIKKL